MGYFFHLLALAAVLKLIEAWLESLEGSAASQVSLRSLWDGSVSPWGC